MEKKCKVSKVTIVWLYDAIAIVFISLLSLLIISCNSPFSKYEKKGKNDLEKARLHGKVKQVIKYYGNEIAKISQYNEYGFLTKKVEFEDGIESESSSYSYDAYGCLIKIIFKNKGSKGEIEKTYDDKHNLISSYINNHEVYNEYNTIGRKLQELHEYEYDKMGNILSDTVKSSDTTPTGNYTIVKYNLNGNIVEKKSIGEHGNVSTIVRYNSNGDILELVYFDEAGNLSSAYKYEYYANNKHYRTIEYNSSGTIRCYYETVYISEEEQTYTRYSLESESEPVCIKSTYNNNKDLIFLVNPYGHNEKHEYKYDNHNNIIFHCVTFVDTEEVNTERYEITYY